MWTNNPRATKKIITDVFPNRLAEEILGFTSARWSNCQSGSLRTGCRIFRFPALSFIGRLYKGSHPGGKVMFFWTLFKRPLTPPPPFIWTFVLFCGGYFLNAFLSIKNGSNKEKNIFGGINCRGRAPLNQRSFERCSKKFGHCSKICAMFKNSLFVYDGVP